MGRPSIAYIQAVQNDDQQITAVKVGGKCVFVGSGHLFLD